MCCTRYGIFVWNEWENIASYSKNGESYMALKVIRFSCPTNTSVLSMFSTVQERAIMCNLPKNEKHVLLHSLFVNLKIGLYGYGVCVCERASVFMVRAYGFTV